MSATNTSPQGIPEKGIGASAPAAQTSAQAPATSNPTPKKDDPVAKFVGDAAGEATKKALGINF